MLGLKHTTVKLVPHSYKWRYLFQEEVINIRHVLKNSHLRIEHVGSTALPEIAAKPILDIFIPCDDLSVVSGLSDTLATLGYEFVTDAHTYKLFIKGPEEARTHHLTFTSPDDTYWNETIQFRDHLLANPLVAKAYETEKVNLASQYATSRRNYSSNKARFIQSVLRDINSYTPEVKPPLSLLSTHVNPNINSRDSISITQADLDNFKGTDTSRNVSDYTPASGEQPSNQL